MDLAKPIDQNGSKKIDDNKNIKIPVLKGRKIIITTANTISVCRKLLTALTTVILPECWQDVRVKKIWIKITS